MHLSTVPAEQKIQGLSEYLLSSLQSLRCIQLFFQRLWPPEEFRYRISSSLPAPAFVPALVLLRM